MGNIISYYTDDQDFRIGYPTEGALVQQVHKFILYSVDFQASNTTTSNGWTVSSVSDGGSYYNVTFTYKVNNSDANLDLTTLAVDEQLVAHIDVSIAQLSNSTVIDWYTDKDSSDFETTYDDAEAILLVKNGQYAGAGGDPHIKPLYGNNYSLPSGEHTFLLYSNNDPTFHVSVKAKCWFLPEEKYERKIRQMYASGYIERAEKHLLLFKEGTFFRYVEIVASTDHIIVDMTNLELCEFNGIERVDNFTLSNLDSYQGTGCMDISCVRRPAQGIFGSTSYRSTRSRKITINYPKFQIIIMLIKDSRNISIRNSVELTTKGGYYGQTGALVQESVIYTQFGENYN